MVERRGVPLLLSLLAAALPACKHSHTARHDRALAKKVAACARAVEHAAEVGPGERAQTVAHGCPYACAGLSEYDTAGAQGGLSALTPGCRLFCSDQAAAAFQQAPRGEKLDALVDTCGPQYYGLPQGRRDLMSGTWFVLDRVDSWLAHARGRAGTAKAMAALDRATERVHFLLPPPAERKGLYSLPVSRRSIPVRSFFYVIVGAHEVSAGAMQIARLRGKHPETRPVPGGPFPGKKMAEGKLAAEFLALVKEVSSLHPGGMHLTPHPLLLADAALPARRLFAVAAALGQKRVYLGVGGESARAHPVVLQRIPPFGSAAPVVRVSAAGFKIGDEKVVPRGDLAGRELAEKLLRLVALRAPLDRVEVRMDSASTVRDLIPVLDAAADAGIHIALWGPDRSVPPDAGPAR